MRITFRDDVGMITVDVDEYGIQFLDGMCYFSTDDKEYKIPVYNVVEIV